jgi:hypothetical protein
MRIFIHRLFALAVAAGLLQLGSTMAQTAKRQSAMLVTWFGPGGIELPTGGDWRPQLFTVYDGGRRPVAQYQKGADVNVSFILFENQSGNPTALGCRDDAVTPIIQHMGPQISKRVDGEMKNSDGEALATTSYLVSMTSGRYQHNIFGFAGDATTCAEIHVSTATETPAGESAMKAVVTAFHPNLTYKATAIDYFRIGSVLFKNAPASAAPYYRSSLAALPMESANLTARRVTTDQLVMSLGMSGDMTESRSVAEKAIASDPEYPVNYYNLACIDAEQGNAKDAKEHLKQAFDRRANVLQGESMPDPTKDDSILKLKGNREFWAFVESLPRN